MAFTYDYKTCKWIVFNVRADWSETNTRDWDRTQLRFKNKHSKDKKLETKFES